MKDLLVDEFQHAVADCLVRHRSVLDVLSKFQEANARVHRAVAKAVTSCGCISIHAQRPKIPAQSTLRDLKSYMDDHVDGTLCESCREVLEEELGKQLFYLVALCNLFDINTFDLFIKENRKLSTLGMYHIS
ncbi:MULTISPECIES: hypothetical protein [Thermaerobacter]|uniref:DUF1573 domain-containing protein n=1 Tax=Thermaerobacter subterraneus DSM 13965 TaxID=867903 RepID=K6PPH5_9FIRM|nr:MULTISPECIES: hypothetical protein [Thermaerobacter]EKP94822.1 hypothetical protein ThesuDRAFT_00528 [Thermaerobacter subterraneus DSM 13965]QIA28072.1 DUF1573 domain-containing protein [Thermaerobacter sp. PB12/4term]